MRKSLSFPSCSDKLRKRRAITCSDKLRKRPRAERRVMGIFCNFAAGRGIPHEEVMREMDEEIERWEQEYLKLQMAEAI